MLGARARAAEYNAAKAASARQASREAEEQKLPPKPVPVSLSAFTKNTPLNRNKGTKSWIPLVLEDTPEDDDESSEEDGCALSTPTRKTGNPTTRGNPSLRADEIFSAPPIPQPVRNTMPQMPIPTAPKAMTQSTQRASAIVVPTPRRMQPHSIITQAERDVSNAVRSSPSNLSGTSGFPTHTFFWTFNSQGYPVLGQVPLALCNPPCYSAPIMGPLDLSPSKQEVRMNMLAREYAHPSPSFAAADQPYSNSPGMDGNSMLYQFATPHYPRVLPGWNSYQHVGTLAQNPFHGPTMQQVGSDILISDHGAMSGTLPLSTATSTGHLSHQNSAGTALGRKQFMDHGRESVDQRSQRKSATPVDEPYDRNSKMQSFVAEQQALARTGKTVLHNPDLHRVKTSEAPTPISTESTTTTSEQDSQSGLTEQSLGPRHQSVLRPPPGLEPPSTKNANWEEFETGSRTPLADADLQKEFAVGTDDWYELKPVTKSQRVKMNKAVRLYGTGGNNEASNAMSLNVPGTRQETIRKWLQKDGRNNQAAQNVVDQIVRDHLADRLSNLSSVDGVGNDRAVNAEIEGAVIRAVGTIWASLSKDTESLAGLGGGSVVWKYKPAPEYAIERGRLLPGNGGSTSFFEEETSGFYSAPSRIARDPRFRPPSKEGIKSKSEDDWKRRHEIYGRRRM